MDPRGAIASSSSALLAVTNAYVALEAMRQDYVVSDLALTTFVGRLRGGIRGELQRQLVRLAARGSHH